MASVSTWPNLAWSMYMYNFFGCSIVCLSVCLSVSSWCVCIQVDAISADWAARADLPQHVVQMVANFPNTLHPMSQFSAAITAMQMESKFARAYAEGLNKNKYWEVCVCVLAVWSLLHHLCML